MEITPETNINALLETYPQLEKFLMELNPKYKKLKNPVLRRTIARIATLKQVALIGGYETLDLVNRLREQVGQAPLDQGEKPAKHEEKEAPPSWIPEEPAVRLDGGALLDAEKNPLAEVRKALKQQPPGSVLLLETDFLPAPLIDTFREEGYQVYTREIDSQHYRTWIRKA